MSSQPSSREASNRLSTWAETRGDSARVRINRFPSPLPLHTSTHPPSSPASSQLSLSLKSLSQTPRPETPDSHSHHLFTVNLQDHVKYSHAKCYHCLACITLNLTLCWSWLLVCVLSYEEVPVYFSHNKTSRMAYSKHFTNWPVLTSYRCPQCQKNKHFISSPT